MKDSITKAVQNIAKHGDTDVFPYPIERAIFFDREAEVIALLEKVHANFDGFLFDQSPFFENSLAAVGYSGFRSVTQIDPYWNAYLLALVIAIGSDIESSRLQSNKEVVFSYRYNFGTEEKTIFAVDSGWREFRTRSLSLAEQFPFTLICDISDFYSRIYHHRLENALKKATNDGESVRRIMEILKRLSGGVSYSLPVGGPAARLLSELVLNRVDRLLMSEGVSFCRFADDYHVFARSHEQAYEHLVFLSRALLENEGLSLQKSKTKILSAKEFKATLNLVGEDDTPEVKEMKQFVSIRLRFDPYSPTAVEDYEELRRQVSQVDIVGMLTRELKKSRIHQALVRKLISAIRFLEPEVKTAAVKSLLDNLSTLYPVFPSVMLVVRNVVTEMHENDKSEVFAAIRNLFKTDSFILKVPVNLAYAIRVLGLDPSEEAELLLVDVYKGPQPAFIRRDIILLMANRGADFWLSNERRRFQSMTLWEQRAMIIASYLLGDEGSHWRDQIRKGLADTEILIRDWAASKKKAGSFVMPL